MWQIERLHFLPRHATGAHDDIDSREHFAGCASDRNSDRPDGKPGRAVRHRVVILADRLENVPQPEPAGQSALRIRDQLDPCRVGVEISFRTIRQEYKSAGRAVGGPPASGIQSCRDDSRTDRSGHIHNVVALRRCERARLADRVAHAVKKRLRREHQRTGRGVGIGDCQQRRQKEKRSPVLRSDVAKAGQRQQAAPNGPARQAGLDAQLRRRHPRAFGGESQDYGQAAGQRSHEIPVGCPQSHGAIIARLRTWLMVSEIA